MKLLEWFDDIENDEFIMILVAFIVVLVPGYVIGFIKSYKGLIYTAIVISALFAVWGLLYYYANFHYQRQETEIIKELPSFPQHDFCDACGKELEGAEHLFDGEFLHIKCPNCGEENIVVNEEVVDTLKEEEKED